MQFSEANPTVSQSYARRSFHLPPVSFAIQAAEACQIANSVARSDRLDIRDVAYELEIHRREIVPFRSFWLFDSMSPTEEHFHPDRPSRQRTGVHESRTPIRVGFPVTQILHVVAKVPWFRVLTVLELHQPAQ
jgi:hypothetical protein